MEVEEYGRVRSGAQTYHAVAVRLVNAAGGVSQASLGLQDCARLYGARLAPVDYKRGRVARRHCCNNSRRG